MVEDEVRYQCCHDRCPTPDTTEIVRAACKSKIFFPAAVARHVDIANEPSLVIVKCLSDHECEYEC